MIKQVMGPYIEVSKGQRIKYESDKLIALGIVLVLASILPLHPNLGMWSYLAVIVATTPLIIYIAYSQRSYLELETILTQTTNRAVYYSILKRMIVYGLILTLLLYSKQFTLTELPQSSTNPLAILSYLLLVLSIMNVEMILHILCEGSMTSILITLLLPVVDYIVSITMELSIYTPARMAQGEVLVHEHLIYFTALFILTTCGFFLTDRLSRDRDHLRKGEDY